MKIIANNKVYVQLNDITYLMKAVTGLSIPVPSSVIETCFSKMFICNDNNRYKFIEFSDYDAIKFFEKLDYIVDYMTLKDMSDDEIIQYGTSVANKKNELAKKFNSMSDTEKTKHQKMIIEYELLDFKMYSVRDILLFRQGDLKMTLPDCVDYPNIISQNEDTGIKKYIKKIIKKLI